MLEINLTAIVLTLKGEPLMKQKTEGGVPQFLSPGVPMLIPSGESYGQVLADVLAGSSSKHSRKLYGIAKALYANEPLMIDGEDFDLLFKTVEDSQLLDFVKAPILETLVAAKH